MHKGIACSLPITTHRRKSLRSEQGLKSSAIMPMILCPWTGTHAKCLSSWVNGEPEITAHIECSGCTPQPGLAEPGKNSDASGLRFRNQSALRTGGQRLLERRRPRGWVSRSGRGCGPHVLFHFVLGDIADVSCEVPPVPERIFETGGAIAIELVGERANDLGAGRGGLFGGSVYILQVDMEGNG